MGCSDIGLWIRGGLAGSACLVDVVLGSDVRGSWCAHMVIDVDHQAVRIKDLFSYPARQVDCNENKRSIILGCPL